MGKGKRFHRIIDLAAIKKMKELPCFICREPGPNDCHELRFEPPRFTEWMTLCSMHHRDAHRLTLVAFIKKYDLPILL